jgi:hypothetical protein
MSTLQLLSRDLNSIFPTKFWCFAPPPKKNLALCAEIFHPKKWLGPNKQFLGALRTWDPPAPLSRRPWSCIDQIIYSGIASPTIQSRYANIAMFINYQHNQFLKILLIMSWNLHSGTKSSGYSYATDHITWITNLKMWVIDHASLTIDYSRDNTFYI